MGRGRRQIVLLDDNALVRALCSERLEVEGYAVQAISSPFELAAALVLYQPDAALIDVSMPALKGHELVRFLRRRSLEGGDQDCLLILYSDRPAQELEELTLRCGADAFVPKANGFDYLLQRLTELIESRDERRSSCPT